MSKAAAASDARGESSSRCRIDLVRAGLYLTLELPQGTDESAIIEERQRHSIGLYGTRAYYARPEAAPPGLLLGYCRLSERDAVEGVRRIASLIRRAGRRREDNHPGDDELAVRAEQR